MATMALSRNLLFNPTATLAGSAVRPPYGTASPVILPRPQYILLGSVAPSWRVHQPLLLTLTIESDGYCIFADDIFLLYGEGESVRVALQDYIDTLISHYRMVSEDAGDNAFDRILLARLQEYLTPTA